MKIARSIAEVKEEVKGWKKSGFTIGFVPTMGSLHEGHKSLINKSVEENQKTIVSIFVNPKQFSKGEDLDKYPRTFKQDRELCQSFHVDLIFYPSEEEMYPKDFFTYIDVDCLGEELCGKFRESHFRGICTVVNKLLNISGASRAYFGEKDIQQLTIIKKMVKDLNMNIQVVGCATVREADGLAMSSRNTYLNEKEREVASNIYKALIAGKESYEKGRTIDLIKGEIKEILEKEPLIKIQYIEVVDNETLKPLEELKYETGCIIALAVFIGETRLIDNLLLGYK